MLITSDDSLIAHRVTRWAIIDSYCTSNTSSLETYYSNFIARQFICTKVPEVQEDFIRARGGTPLMSDTLIIVALVSSLVFYIYR